MKAVLISIRPEWCDLIASGKKTVEVRKTYPKLETPFKVYIYCTKGDSQFSEGDRFCLYAPPHDTPVNANQSVIGEFICSQICAVLAHPSIFAGHPLFFEKAIDDACLTKEEVEEYCGDKDAFGWVISNLKIYDRPRSLSKFRIPCKEYQRADPRCGNCDHYKTMGEYPAECAVEGAKPIARPPQSWCYVEELP